MEQIAKTKRPFYLHFLFLSGLVLLLLGLAVILIRIEPWLPIFVMIGLGAVVLILMNPDIGVGIYLMTFPLLGIHVMDMPLGGIPGLKLSNLIPLLVILAIILENAQESLRGRDFLFSIGLFILFTIAIFRSMSLFQMEPSPLIMDGTYNPFRYLLSFWIRPLLYFLAMWIVTVRRHSVDQIKQLLLFMQVSLLGLSIYLLYMYLFVITDHTNFEAVREAFGKALGLHGNGIADFYIIGFPLLLVYAHLNKNLFSLVNISLAFVAIAITYSRTAYFTIIIEIVLYIILIRKASFLPIVGVAGAIVLKFLPQSVLDRAVTGAGAGDANALSAGRTDNIWVPLVSELMRKPGQLFFGNGRYSILHSDAMKNNEILKVIHAHNFYLDTVLDMGLLGLAFFLTFYLMMLMQTNKLRRETKNPFFQVMSSGLTVCVLGFMIRGLSDSSMLPTANNAYIWVIFGFCQLLTMVAEKHPEYSAIQST